MTDYRTDWMLKARHVLAGPPDEPWPAWSTGEVLAVALILGRDDVLTDLEFTREQALRRLSYDLMVDEGDAAAEFDAIREATLTGSTVVPVVSQYAVTAATGSRAAEPHWEIQVQRMIQMGDGELWAVRWMGMCLGADGAWDHEPSPSYRTEEWLATHRFPLDAALLLARQAAPWLVVNGRRPDGSWVDES